VLVLAAGNLSGRSAGGRHTPTFPNARSYTRAVSGPGTGGPDLAETPGRLTRAAVRLESQRPSVRALLAFLSYLLVSLALWSRGVIAHLSTRYVGVGKEDAKLYVWTLAWWPYAIRHGLNPLHSPLVWAPAGVNMAWISGMPGPALVLTPVTMAANAVASLNVLLLLAPPLAAWAGYLLCGRLAHSFWPAVAGGFVFGFSTYEVAQMHGHANLVLVFPVALAAYLVVRRIEGSLGRLAFVALLTLVLVAEFSISTEIFLTMTLFGGLVLAGAYVFGPKDGRRGVLDTAVLIAASYAATAVLVSPYLVAALSAVPPGPIRNGNTISVDLLSFVLPRFSTLVGGNAFRPLTRRLLVTDVEDGAYLGLFLLVIVLFAIRDRRRRSTWILVVVVAVAAVAALGPVLHIHSHPSVRLPWSLTAGVPLLRDAVPARLTLYLWLATAVIVALWLAGARGRTAWASWGVVAIGALMILPVTSSPPYRPPVQVPAFFTRGEDRRYLAPGEIVLAIPAEKGQEMLWQVESEMYFRLARGYVGVPPTLVTTGVLGKNEEIPRYPPAFRGFIAAHDVGAVVVEDSAVLTWLDDLGSLGVKPLRIGGVAVYPVTPAA
jgi:hypothetical protein